MPHASITSLAFVAFQLLSQNVCISSFTIPTSSINSNIPQTSTTSLYAEKQSRSSLLRPPKSKQTPVAAAAEEEEEEVFGAKFFGGNAIKEELFDEALEAKADRLSRLYPKNVADDVSVSLVENDKIYNRFMDEKAFDEPSRSLARRLQTAINQALYIPEDGDEGIININEVYSPNLQWKTPLAKSTESNNPLDELTKSLDFYKRVDVAILSAKSESPNADDAVQKINVRWEISVLWPNTWESRVIITGTSALTVSNDNDNGSMIIMSQTDRLDNGGKDGQDTIQAIASQIQPRFWDLYHLGMAPTAELMPRLQPSNQKQGLLSKYNLFEIPERLILQPSMEDTGGRLAREAECLPNHAFSSIITTVGPNAQRYTPTSPIEVSIKRESNGEDGESKSVIYWKVPLPAEFVSYYDELTAGDDEEELDSSCGCSYSYQSKRLVATLPYGGSAQDKEVSDVRKDLYEKVTKDGLKPKLDENGRPQFFFLNNDAKACFTADGGLGMVVYEWRPEFSESNEVGIELEL